LIVDVVVSRFWLEICGILQGLITIFYSFDVQVLFMQWKNVIYVIVDEESVWNSMWLLKM